MKNKLKTIVFRPDPVQGPSSGFWPGHWIARVDSFFLNQNDVVLVKKKSQRVVTGFLTVSYRVKPPGRTGFFLSLFFFQPGPVPAPGRPTGPDWVSKLCLKQ
jgi:hypothetical protein